MVARNKQLFPIVNTRTMEALLKLMEKYNVEELAYEQLTIKRGKSDVIKSHNDRKVIKHLPLEPTDKEILDKHESEVIPMSLDQIIENDPDFAMFELGIPPVKE